MIKVLSEHLCNLIAAGEVVERPLSVVKELVENCLDAKATKIEIELYNSGIDKIRIIDDGCGMDEHDLELCILRHATSKIYEENDLLKIISLGFRGEALASIGSVSNLKIASRNENGAGKVIEVNFGKKKELMNISMQKGTDITVSNLFINTPARLKHLKSGFTELNLIVDYVQKISLSYPEVSFVLKHNDKTIFQSFGRNNIKEIYGNIFGYQSVKNFLETKFANEDFQVEFYLLHPQHHRANRNQIVTIVNNRVVHCTNIQFALINALAQYYPQNRYPICLIKIKCDPYLLDVNIHPSKYQIKISKENELNDLIAQNVKKLLEVAMKPAEIDLVKEISKKENVSTAKEQIKKENEELKFDLNQLIIKEAVYNLDHCEEINIIQEKETDSSTLSNYHNPFTIIGQYAGSFIIAYDLEGLVIFDQHAAMERINVEDIEKRILEEKNTCELLLPEIFELSHNEYNLVLKHQDKLAQIGIMIEPFGANTVRITNVPIYLANYDLRAYFFEILEQLLKNNNIDLAQLRKNAIDSLACHKSLKINTYLTLAEQKRLIDDLMKCKQPFNCPHGRPIMIRFSAKELEKMFKRT